MIEHQETTKAKILIVEDEGLIGVDLQHRLARRGYRITGLASSAEEALELIAEDPPDLVLMDIVIQGETDGIAAAEIIRSRWDIPVIFTTAYADQERINRAKLIHPFGYLIKPYQEREIEVTIEIALFVAKKEAEREKAEETLRESEEKYRSFVENFKGIAYRAGMDWIPIFFHGAVGEITGYEEEDFVKGRPRWDQIIHPEDFSIILNDHEKKLRTEPHFSYERDYRIIRKDKEIRWVREQIQNICDTSGKPFLLQGTLYDITERKQVEESLRKSEVKYRILFEESFDGLFITSSGGRILDINKKGVRMFGYETKEDMLQLDLAKDIYADPLDRPRILSMVDAQGTAEYDVVVKKKTGETMITHCSLTAAEDEQGLITAYRGIIRDITEQKRMEEALKEAEGKYRSLTMTDDLMYLIDRQDRYQFMNEACLSRLGLSLQDVLGRSYNEFHSEENSKIFTEIIEEVFATNSSKQVEHKSEKDSKHFLRTFSPIRDPQGNVSAVTVISKDISERKEMEQKLKEAFTEIKALQERLEAENILLRDQVLATQPYGNLVAESQSMKEAISQAKQVAGSDSTVLILGETGTGKELLARGIHAWGSRKDKSLVIVNCAAMPATLVESELFGREKGAFTGALTRQAGRFEIADGGTLFLDEVSELTPEIQVKLLRVLQEGEFERLGSTKTIKTNVRVLAATNGDLSDLIAKGAFRKDLYYRLNVFPLRIPPLRERVEDIPPLIWAFVKEFSGRMGKIIETIPRKIMNDLQRYHWPGNVRELRNTVERAMIISNGPVLQIRIPVDDRKEAPLSTLDDIQRRHIVQILNQTNWRIRGEKGAAAILGLKPSTLRSKMEKLGIRRDG